MTDQTQELPVAIRRSPLNGKLVPVLCCAESGRVLAGQVSVDVSVGASTPAGPSMFRVSSEIWVAAEDAEPASGRSGGRS